METCIIMNNSLRIRVDQEDMDLANFTWSLGGDGYPLRQIKYDTGVKSPVVLHRVIASRKFNLPLNNLPLIEHRNDDRLDCRRDNLLLSNKRLNTLRATLNRGAQASWNERTQAWVVQLKFEKHGLYLSSHKDKVLADKLKREALETLINLLETNPVITYEQIYLHFKGKQK